MFVLLFTVGIYPNICDFGHVVFLSASLIGFFAHKKYNMAKVTNILVDSHCKKENKDMTITAQWNLLKLGQNVLLSECYKLVLVSRNAFFGNNTVALGQSVFQSDHYAC